MIVVKNLEALQFMSFEDSISYFLPTAKNIRIFYTLNWLTLKQKTRPSHIQFFWMRIEHPEFLKEFEECITNASVKEAPDELIFVDPRTKEGQDILNQYA